MRNKKGFALSILFVFFICGVTIPLFMTNHRKVKADTITDLTGTIWIINNNIDAYTAANSFPAPLSINMKCNDVYGNSVTSNYDDGDMYIHLNNNNNYVALIIGSDWQGLGNTLEFISGTDITNLSLINWLQTYCTQQAPVQTDTEITNRYWSPSGVFYLENNAIYSDNSIEYYILFNQYDSELEDTEQTGLYFEGYNTIDLHSYIRSNTSYMYIGSSNSITNRMLLEFNVGDYMDSNLYNFMNVIGYWFNDYEPYNLGIYQGYIEGHRIGVAEGQANGVQYTGLVTGIFNGLGSLLSIQVFPNITIGLLIGLPLLLGVLIIIIKLLRG